MSGSIGVTLRSRPPAKIGPGLSAVQVFFVKLEDGSEAFSATELIPSNYSNKRQVYLLNADPGRYVAVAAGLRNTKGQKKVTLAKAKIGKVGVSVSTSFDTGSDFSDFFSMAMISETEVTVVPQEMVFMGEYLASTSTKIKRADAAQAHYFRLLLPGEAGKTALTRNLGGQIVYTADIKSVAKDAETERGFWTMARDLVFKNDPRWQARAKRQLAALSEQEPN